LLRALETRHASVVTVKGSFDQLKISEIFLEEIRSKGTFWYQKPDLFRCDYEPPDEMTNLILKDAIYVYVPSIEQCEIYRFRSEQERDQQLHSMVLGFGFKTDELLEAYAVTSSEDGGSLADELGKTGQAGGDTALLHLVPLPGLEDTSPFTSLKLWINKGSLLPEKVSFEDYNGDKTMIELRSIDLNAAVDAKQFVPSFPAGTEYIDKSETSSGD
jgi:outer membrane lipoprotein-sorting protein